MQGQPWGQEARWAPLTGGWPVRLSQKGLLVSGGELLDQGSWFPGQALLVMLQVPGLGAREGGWTLVSGTVARGPLTLLLGRRPTHLIFPLAKPGFPPCSSTRVPDRAR